ncbi:methyltransferase domain-containing protein [Kitasatospora sp. NPDC093102]|uniref:methyltransferase domain-containing protein n=1 Tax=Kitasatospora sp. NPDC093102 TaxID=3155069 RepID=UPI00342AA815
MPSRTRHPLFARFYPRVNAYADAHGGLEHRRELLMDTSGRFLEIGVGPGANFRHYPKAVQHVLAVEPEPRLRRLAEQAATTATVPVEVHDGRTEQLSADDESDWPLRTIVRGTWMTDLKVFR